MVILFAPFRGIWILESGKFLLKESVIWKSLLVESRILESGSGIQLKESGIPLTIGIQNPNFTDKDWNPVPGIRDPQREIHNPRLSWIPLHEAI